MFLKLEKELKGFRDILNQASSEMRNQEISMYPIFVVHQQEVELGVLIIDRETTTSAWSIHASSLEEFTYKGLIRAEKLDEFRSVYKDADDFFCLFVISQLGAQFIFLPQVGKE
jgi:hypothetical protein